MSGLKAKIVQAGNQVVTNNHTILYNRDQPNQHPSKAIGGTIYASLEEDIKKLDEKAQEGVDALEEVDEVRALAMGADEKSDEALTLADSKIDSSNLLPGENIVLTKKGKDTIISVPREGVQYVDKRQVVVTGTQPIIHTGITGGTDIATYENAISGGEYEDMPQFLENAFDNIWTEAEAWQSKQRGAECAGNAWIGNKNILEKVLAISFQQSDYLSRRAKSILIEISNDNGITWETMKTYVPVTGNKREIVDLGDYAFSAPYALRIACNSELPGVEPWVIWEFELLKDTTTAFMAGGFSVTNARGFNPQSDPIDKITHFGYDINLGYSNGTVYYYAFDDKTIKAENSNQLGDYIFPMTAVEGQIFFYLSLMKNYKYQSGTWVEYNGVYIGSIINGTAYPIELNRYPWEPDVLIKHNQTYERDAENAHPINAITGLAQELTDINIDLDTHETQIQSLMGGIHYIGEIFINNPTQAALTARAMELRGELRDGYTLIEAGNRHEWRYDVNGVVWVDLGEATVVPATATDAGIAKLYDEEGANTDGAITQAKYTAHANDAIKHTSQAEKDSWNAKVNRSGDTVNGKLTVKSFSIINAVNPGVDDAQIASSDLVYFLNRGINVGGAGSIIRGTLYKDAWNGPKALWTTDKGIANGVASLDAAGKIPASQIDATLKESLTFNRASADKNAALPYTAPKRGVWVGLYRGVSTGLITSVLIDGVDYGFGHFSAATLSNIDCSSVMVPVDAGETLSYSQAPLPANIYKNVFIPYKD